jgi:5-aminolevulinate synthase
VSAALASVRHLRFDTGLRARLMERAASLKAALDAAGIPRLPSESHIVPVHVGDASRCKEVARRLLNEHAIYATPINYPTVPRGTERLRLCATPFHTDAMIADLAVALQAVMSRRLPKAA